MDRGGEVRGQQIAKFNYEESNRVRRIGRPNYFNSLDRPGIRRSEMSSILKKQIEDYIHNGGIIHRIVK